MEAGDVVGEGSVIDAKPRSATVVADRDKDGKGLEVLALHADGWHILEATYPGVAKKIIDTSRLRKEENARRTAIANPQ